MPRVSIVRDVLLLLATAALWWQDALARQAGQGGAAARAVSIGAGVLAAVTGFLLHEWGHLIGALLVKSKVHYPNRIFAVFLFHFDTQLNDKRQFLWMSYGGYLASMVGVAVIASLAPLSAWSERIALVLAGFGMLATFAAEIPITVRVLRGKPMPTGYVYQPPP